MEIQTVVYGKLDNNNHILSVDNDVVIIDAGAPAQELFPYVEGKNVKGILITHAHYDHIQYLKELLDAFNCKAYMHKNAVSKLKNSDLNVSYFDTPFTLDIDDSKIEVVGEGDKLNLLKDEITVIELPGHSDCGLGFVINNTLFSGDTLFANTYGRTDLPTSSSLQMRNSLKRLFSDYFGFELYCGHGQSSKVK